jgi:Calcineurin-like phosphoesterase
MKRLAVAVVAVLTVAGVVWVRTNARALTATVSFSPVADAFVSSAHPRQNFGARNQLETDGSPTVNSYLRFQAHGLSGRVVRATLEVYATGSANGIVGAGHAVRAVPSTTWREASITYHNAPAMGVTVGTSGLVHPNTWTAVDVTPLVRGNGPLSFAMVGLSTTRLYYRSRETSIPPRLVIRTRTTTTTTAPATTSPPPPTPTTVVTPAHPLYRYMYDHDRSSSGYDRIAAAGFDLVDVGPDPSTLDALTRLKVKGLVWLGDYDNATCSWEQSDSTIRSEVSALKGNPNVAGYFISDEPELDSCPNAPAQHKARSDLVKSLDPGRFTLVVLDSNNADSTSTYAAWRGTSDYQGLDPYPCRPGKPCDLAMIDRHIAAADAAGLRYWGVVQAFADSDWRWPTPDEEAAMLRHWAASHWQGYAVFAWQWAGHTLDSQPGLVDALTTFNDGATATGATTSSSSTTTAPTPPGPTQTTVAGGDPVIEAAGDISDSSGRQKETADLMVADQPTAVLPLGDEAYPDGSSSQYASYYDPSWGRLKARTYPVPGNHDYHTSGGAGYLGYFGQAATGPSGQPFYSYDLGSWHLIALNGEIPLGAGSVQEQWLRADLAAHPSRCVLAYWHEPRWSSGTVHGSDSGFDAFWQDLYAAGADVVLNGHEHNYERFAKQTPAGTRAANGIREFVAGTGGADEGSYPFGTPLATSEVRIPSGNPGVLKLTLHDSSYSWEWKGVPGVSYQDAGSDSCS